MFFKSQKAKSVQKTYVGPVYGIVESFCGRKYAKKEPAARRSILDLDFIFYNIKNFKPKIAILRSYHYTIKESNYQFYKVQRIGKFARRTWSLKL